MLMGEALKLYGVTEELGRDVLLSTIAFRPDARPSAASVLAVEWLRDDDASDVIGELGEEYGSSRAMKRVRSDEVPAVAPGP